MNLGIVNLWCPICQNGIKLDHSDPKDVRHHKEFGYVCSKICFDEAGAKYTRMILGKDDAPAELFKY